MKWKVCYCFGPVECSNWIPIVEMFLFQAPHFPRKCHQLRDEIKRKQPRVLDAVTTLVSCQFWFYWQRLAFSSSFITWRNFDEKLLICQIFGGILSKTDRRGFLPHLIGIWPCSISYGRQNTQKHLKWKEEEEHWCIIWNFSSLIS